MTWQLCVVIAFWVFVFMNHPRISIVIKSLYYKSFTTKFHEEPEIEEPIKKLPHPNKAN